MNPHIFKGLPGEKPDLHFLKASDWLENNRSPEHEKYHDFMYTIDDVAQGWYDDIVVLVYWNALQALFHKYFFIQDR